MGYLCVSVRLCFFTAKRLSRTVNLCLSDSSLQLDIDSLKYFVVLKFSEAGYDGLFLFADIASSCREDNKSNEIFYLCIFSAA